MKHLLYIVLIALLTACGGGGDGTESGGIPGYGNTVALPADTVPGDPVPCTVTLYGDSILHGSVGPGGGRLAVPPAKWLKTQRPSYTVQDLSEPGASAVLKEPMVLNVPAAGAIVVVQYGVNDSGAFEPARYEASMDSIIKFELSQGKKVVVTGLSQGSPPRRAEFDAIASKVAAANKVSFADWGSVKGDSPDGVHPGQEFSKALTDQLIHTLDKIAPACK